MGLTREYADPAAPWAADDSTLLSGPLSWRKSTVDEFDFLTVDRTTHTVTIKPGTWRLERALVIPHGFTFLSGPGVTLELAAPSANIISHAPLLFDGTADKPIVIRADPKNRSCGVAVIDVGGQSRLEHVRFEGLSAPEDGELSYSGAVTFYQSPVELRHCEISGNTCEDALNCVRSDFRLVDCAFSDTYSDALDADFSNGSVERGVFTNCGNDGIDVSGSQLTVSATVITGAQDKGVSLGENSVGKITDLTVRNTEIALAAKDLSQATVDGLTVDSCRIGFTIFQKKSEFGEAEVSAARVTLNAVEVPYLLENNSRLTLNGAAAAPNEDQVKGMLYGIKYGKASK